MSTERQDVALAELARDIKHLLQSIEKMEKRLDEIASTFATKTDLMDLKIHKEKEHEDYEKRIRTLEYTYTQVKTWGGMGLIVIPTLISWLISKL